MDKKDFDPNSLPKTEKVYPDKSRNKYYTNEKKGRLRTEVTLNCPVFIRGVPFWGECNRSFFNALEGEGTLMCPTQQPTRDQLLRPGVMDKVATKGEFDNLRKDT
jgi:hypothetical protein